MANGATTDYIGTAGMKRPRILIADDHPHVLECISVLLASEYDVVAAVSDGQAAVNAAVVLRPDVVILDISMPVLSGLQAAARLVDGACQASIVFLTVHEDPAFLEAARNVGARGYVLKRTIAADLLPAIRLVLEGRPAFPVR
jgi:DNA-binding NarL/FixJ family response regulator